MSIIMFDMQLFGRNLLWFAAVFGTITAISRSAVIEEFQVFEPERYLRLVACFTHYMPKHWRGAENKDVVRTEFESLFQVVILFVSRAYIMLWGIYHWYIHVHISLITFSCASLQYTGMTLLEELISIFVTPYALLFLLPKVNPLKIYCMLLFELNL